jgi:hypothetical protein
LICAPHHNQRAATSDVAVFEGDPTPDPRMAWSWHQLIRSLTSGTGGCKGRFLAHP